MSCKCQNCGQPGFETKEPDYRCKSCGYHEIKSKELPAIQMLYCEGCGCIYSTGCTIHDKEIQKPIKV